MAPRPALQSFKPEIGLLCLAAIAIGQTWPLVKVPMFITHVDDFARVALLRAYRKESRLLAVVDRIAVRAARNSDHRVS